MIAYLTGKIVSSSANELILLTTSGLGYKVRVTSSTSSKLIGNGEANNVELFIYHHIREDISDLYGFDDQHSQAFFEKLISINGIGPKTALEIMSMPIQNLEEAIEKEDVSALCKIKGLGKKSAERIILELKGNLPSTIGAKSANETENIHQDTIKALEQLGYKRAHITNIFKEMPSNLHEIEEQVRFFLQNV